MGGRIGSVYCVVEKRGRFWFAEHPAASCQCAAGTMLLHRRKILLVFYSRRNILLTLATVLACARGLAQFGGDSGPAPTPTPLPQVDSDTPALHSLYRGRPDAVIAATPWGDLSEAGLYLYLLVSGQGRADVLERWRGEATPERRAELERTVRQAIRRWAGVMAMAGQGADAAPDTAVGRFRFICMVHPVHELVWIDRFLQPQVVILPQDVSKYLEDHPGLTEPPRRASARMLFLRVGKGEVDADTGIARASRAEWDAAENRMMRILDRIALGRLTFEEAVRQHSEASNAQAGGLVPEFSPGQYFPRFEDEAFGLDPGEIGRVFRGPQGLYVLQGLRAAPLPPLTFEQVRPRIESELRLRQMRARYAFEKHALRQKGRVYKQTGRLDVIAPGATAFRVGRIDLTRDDIWTACPEFVKEDFSLNMHELSWRCDRIAGLELIAQFNIAQGWGEDERLRQARRMARLILSAEQRVTERLQPLLRMTPRQAVEYAMAHPDMLIDLNEPRISRIGVELSEEGGKVGIPHRAHALRRMRETMEAARDAVLAVPLARLAESWPDNGDRPGDLAPLLIERRLLLAADESVVVSRVSSDFCKEAGKKKASELSEEAKNLAEELYQVVGRVRRGETSGKRFLPIEADEKSLTLYYVEQPDYGDRAILGRIWFEVYRRAAETIRTDYVEELADELIESGKLRITLPAPSGG